jgi:four helix bundle protein
MDRFKLGDLAAWQIAAELKDQIAALLKRTRAVESRGFYEQVIRAAESVASNISEGHARYNPGEFANFLRYSRASLEELRERLPDGVRRGFYSAGDIDDIMRLVEREAAVVGALRDSMIRLAKRRKLPKPRT